MFLSLEADPALLRHTRSPNDDEGPFIVFNEILCCGSHIMWQALPRGRSSRAFADKGLLDHDVGPHATLLKLLDGDVKRHANSVVWRTCGREINITQIMDDLISGFLRGGRAAAW